MPKAGEPIVGILHSVDASLGAVIPLYALGSYDTRVLASDEYLEVHSVLLVTAAGGDCYVSLGPNASVGPGETVVRGTFAANGGVSQDQVDHVGETGHNAYLTAPAGVVDVRFTGSIRKAGDGTTVAPVWMAASFGQ